MKNKNRFPLLLATLLLLCLGALAGMITYLKWKSDLLTDEADRSLTRLEEICTLAGKDGSPSESMPETGSREESVSEKTAEPDTEIPSAANPLWESRLAVYGLAGTSAAQRRFSAIQAKEGGGAPDSGAGPKGGRQADIDEAVSETGEGSDETLNGLAAGMPAADAGSVLLYGGKDRPRRSGTSAYYSERELAQAASVRHHVIFVGDSRTVGMGHAEEKIGDNCIYIGESGEGYNWLVEHGIEQLDEAIRSFPDSPVVFNFGVNDCHAVQAYIEVYRELEKGYPDTSFYYMSVNPVTEESLNVPLSDVLAFNTVLRSAFPDQYIDTCSWMLLGGFDDVDGVHYSQAQYRKIHDYAVLSIEDARRSADQGAEDAQTGTQTDTQLKSAQLNGTQLYGAQTR